MAVTVAHGAVSIGVMGQRVEVQAHVTNGLPSMTIVGLPDTSISESRDRVRSAFANCGFDWPVGRITVGLSPAFEHKRGSGLDLAVAMAVLAAAGSIPPQLVAEPVFLGELGLDGSIRSVPGSVAVALGLARTSDEVVVFASRDTACRIARVPGVQAIPVDDLTAVVEIVRGVRAAPPLVESPLVDSLRPGSTSGVGAASPDLADIIGQARACRSLEVAAAGGHHLYLHGPPGVGKTMLAHRLPGLLPPLDDSQALEVAAILDAADGVLDQIPRTPPFRAPHHSATHIAMVGGAPGGRVRPGQISLAHHGILFLDEAPEFSRVTLESLRQPLEDGVVSIARAAATELLPARFQLVLAANPCPCGSAGTATCRCSAAEVRRYQTRMSGPLLDRVDMRISVAAPIGRRSAEPTAVVRERVMVARERAAARLRTVGERLNCRVPGGVLRREFPPTPQASNLLERWYADRTLSLRALDRIARVSWTLADLGGQDRPGGDEVAEAAALRHTHAEGPAPVATV